MWQCTELHKSCSAGWQIEQVRAVNLLTNKTNHPPLKLPFLSERSAEQLGDARPWSCDQTQAGICGEGAALFKALQSQNGWGRKGPYGPSNPLPWAGCPQQSRLPSTPSNPGWMSPGMGHPQLLWAALCPARVPHSHVGAAPTPQGGLRLGACRRCSPS